jgi:hypothetical protein
MFPCGSHPVEEPHILKIRKESSHLTTLLFTSSHKQGSPSKISIKELCKVNVDRRTFPGDPLIDNHALVGATGHSRQQQLLQSPDWVDLCMENRFALLLLDQHRLVLV